MRAMPKTLDTQGFSGLREEVVRSQGRSPCTAVLKEIIIYQRKWLVYRVSTLWQAFFDVHLMSKRLKK